MSRVAKEFLINLQGKDFVLFSGLLELAHQDGLRETRTELLQIPSDANGHIAIVKATVVTDKGTFQALGDASPDNVNKMILPHIIRMSETRALARALRIATNVGATALEELGEVDLEQISQGERASEKQMALVKKLLAEVPAPQATELVKQTIGNVPRSWEELTKQEASRLIDVIKQSA